MLRLAGAAILLAVSTPASAADWYFVAAAKDGSNISFIDRDSIRDGESGYVRASMFSLWAEPTDGMLAYRFEIEIDCAGKRGRMIAFEPFDTSYKSLGEKTLPNEWIDSGTQGAAISTFICDHGKLGPDNVAAGHQLPFDTGKAMLADRARRNGQ
ncbi:hypothetical protein OF829_03815 [Sphingomonas sp. LB-2]|uniref:surface-adhesin E family protein n=1 Tax=Sphingomonas caeni TaxID=2984949 RepID=UPI0022302F4B|nr:surface-adhesin E family protein [Sphingomonas caeni]MCW3846354.1 hypothetical protein [Sphingomonas caeni]